MGVECSASQAWITFLSDILQYQDKALSCTKVHDGCGPAASHLSGWVVWSSSGNGPVQETPGACEHCRQLLSATPPLIAHSYLLPGRGIPARHHVIQHLWWTGSLVTSFLQAGVWFLDVPASPLGEGDQFPMDALLAAFEFSLPQAGPAGGWALQRQRTASAASQTQEDKEELGVCQTPQIVHRKSITELIPQSPCSVKGKLKNEPQTVTKTLGSIHLHLGFTALHLEYLIFKPQLSCLSSPWFVCP